MRWQIEFGPQNTGGTDSTEEEEAHRSGNCRHSGRMLLKDLDEELLPMHWQHWPEQELLPQELLQLSVCPGAQSTVMRLH